MTAEENGKGGQGKDKRTTPIKKLTESEKKPLDEILEKALMNVKRIVEALEGVEKSGSAEARDLARMIINGTFGDIGDIEDAITLIREAQRGAIIYFPTDKLTLEGRRQTTEIAEDNDDNGEPNIRAKIAEDDREGVEIYARFERASEAYLAKLEQPPTICIPDYASVLDGTVSAWSNREPQEITPFDWSVYAYLYSFYKDPSKGKMFTPHEISKAMGLGDTGKSTQKVAQSIEKWRGIWIRVDTSNEAMYLKKTERESAIYNFDTYHSALIIGAFHEAKSEDFGHKVTLYEMSEPPFWGKWAEERGHYRTVKSEVLAVKGLSKTEANLNLIWGLIYTIHMEGRKKDAKKGYAVDTDSLKTLIRDTRQKCRLIPHIDRILGYWKEIGYLEAYEKETRTARRKGAKVEEPTGKYAITLSKSN